ncbi:unnamed protein product [Prunus armeniaca]|uniref:THO complex subunitTHOC2 N-terminal domain-containing protein n=1 Tax=Prunus armeniaca TaxID=36596 RepID=A0A6J5WYX5_PRUAR|nr:unnamed protein product [Prunus armeniaca]
MRKHHRHYKVLECFELQPDSNVFLELIPIFPKSHASQILGFKFQYYQRLEVYLRAIWAYKLTALLVKEDFIDLDSISCLGIMTLILRECGANLNLFWYVCICTPKICSSTSQDDEALNIIVLFSSKRLDEHAFFEPVRCLYAVVPTIYLFQYHAHFWLFERLSLYTLLSHIKICNSLVRLSENNLFCYDTVRRAHLLSFGSSSGTSVDMAAFCWTLSLSRYFVASEVVKRVVDPSYVFVGNPRLHLKEAKSRIEEALGTCLLPSLQLVPANPAVGQEIWEVMSLLPYELDTRRILKRLAKENLKQLGRMVAKLAHANPMTVLRTIVHQIEAYRDMITPVVDAFKYLTQLEYDVLEYVVMERLCHRGA